MQAQDRLNHMLGQYVAMGVHASRKNPYPKKPFLSHDHETEGFSADSSLDAYILARSNKGGK